MLKILEHVFLKLVPIIFESSWENAMKIVSYPGFQTGFQQLKFTILDINGNSKT